MWSRDRYLDAGLIKGPAIPRRIGLHSRLHGESREYVGRSDGQERRGPSGSLADLEDVREGPIRGYQQRMQKTSTK